MSARLEDDIAVRSYAPDITDVRMHPVCHGAWPKQYVFEQRHGAGLFIVSNTNKKEKFHGDSQKKSIQLLNAFGASIPKLSIQLEMPKAGPLLDAIVGNCHGNLTALKINDVTGNRSELIRPFMQNLGEHFPNLQYLTIEYRSKSNACPYWENMVYEIPSLTHLELNGPFGMGILKQFLQLNRQIESLSVSGESCSCIGNSRPNDYDARGTFSFEKLPSGLFKWLDETLPNLKHLYVNVGLVKKSPAAERDSNVYLKKLETFVCEQFGEKYWVPNMQLLAGDVLEHLEINHKVEGKLIDSVAEKLKRFVNLKQLTINAFSDFIYYMMTTWGANGLRDFIVSKPRLIKIVIRNRATINGQHYIADFGDHEYDGWLKPYRDAVDVELNGFKWEVRTVRLGTIELIKVNPE